MSAVAKRVGEPMYKLMVSIAHRDCKDDEHFMTLCGALDKIFDTFTNAYDGGAGYGFGQRDIDATFESYEDADNAHTVALDWMKSVGLEDAMENGMSDCYIVDLSEWEDEEDDY